jgi:hypothetical protein
VLYVFVCIAGQLHRLGDAYTKVAHTCIARATAATLFLLLATITFLPATRADEPGIPVHREILALYDGGEETSPDSTRVHRYAEMPLNYLGFIVSYWDVSKGLPDVDRLANAHGILTWFLSEQRRKLFVLLQQAAARGVRIVVLGDGGFPNERDSQVEANRLFAQIGFEMTESTIDLTYKTKIIYRDAMIGFERDLDSVLPQYPVVNVVGADVERHLTLEQTEVDASTGSTVVLTSPRGGFAASGYFQYEVPGVAATQWIVDPFAFFTAAFGALPGPIPDVTTISGRRIYFSHIDGDGWSNVSRITRFGDQRMISAAVVQRGLIEAYPDLPVSVGVIGADVDPQYGHVADAQNVARALYQLPQVEVATHTYTHPYSWKFFEHYERAREERALGQSDISWTSRLMMRVRTYSQRLFPGIARDHRDNEIVVSDHPPRAYSSFNFDLDQEISGAVAASQQLAPAGKRTALYLWSGDADPFAEAVARTRRLGIRNLNGGDSRINADAPSIAYIAPIARPVGSERQIYAPDANDYIYMRDDDGREFGFLYLGKAIEATENPRRLKPVDVYYHMYVGERPAELNVVRHHLDYARHAPLAPIAASHYAAIADGFFSAKILQLDGSTWRISDRGALQTVRFDDADRVAVDFGRSVGVLGQERKAATLYVALDAAVDDSIVALSPVDNAKQTVPYLISARWTFSDLHRHQCGFTVDAEGYGEGDMIWGGLPPGTYGVQVRRSNKAILQSETTVDSTGILTLALKADAIEPVLVDLLCRS